MYYVRQKGIDGLVKLRIYEAASIRRLKYSITDATGIPPEIQKLYYTEPSSGRKEELAVSYQHQVGVSPYLNSIANHKGGPPTLCFF